MSKRVYRIDVSLWNQTFTVMVRSPDQRRAEHHVGRSLFKIAVATPEDLAWAAETGIPIADAGEMI